MDDILHILKLLQQRAEADLRVLTNHKSQLLARVSEIKMSIGEREIATLNAKDMQILEHWRRNQMDRMLAVECELVILEKDIDKAKGHYKIILAKKMAAQDISKTILHAEHLLAEEEDTNVVLEVSLLMK